MKTKDTYEMLEKKLIKLLSMKLEEIIKNACPPMSSLFMQQKFLENYRYNSG